MNTANINYRLERASLDDIEEAAQLVSRAFIGDKAIHALMPGIRHRLERIAAVYKIVLSGDCHRRGIIHVARDSDNGQIIGVGAWIGPTHKRYISALSDRLKISRFYSPWENALVHMRSRALKQRHPATRHWYLKALAVDPRVRNQGIGTALLREQLQRIDRAALPTFLVATTEGSRNLYIRQGFVPSEPIPYPNGARAWPMLRRPTAPPSSSMPAESRQGAMN